MEFERNRHYWASCYSTEKFILIETESGLGRTAVDPLFSPYFLSPEENDIKIGETVLKALGNSRLLVDQQDRALVFNLDNIEKNYKAWVTNLLNKYGYRSRRALFKDMRNCSIQATDGMLTISPMHHDTLEGWEGTEGGQNDEVILSVDSPLVEIGEGLRLALSRCT